MAVAEVKPKYKFISNTIKEQILEGKFKPGCKLPGEVELAKKFGVSRIITRQAVQILEREGFVRRKKGSGTFVNELNNGLRPVNKLRQLGFVLVDASASHDYYIWELQAADKWLSRHKISLSIGTITTEELINGKLPTVIEHNDIQGVLLDGVIHDFHRTMAEKAGIPYLIAGNHDVSEDLPQVKFDCVDIGKRATEFLHTASGGKPVVALLEPFRLHFTKEIFEGYIRAVRETGQIKDILQTCSDNNGYEGIKRLFEQGYRDVAILTMDKICSGVLHFLREQGRTTEDNPVLIVGNPHRIQAWEREQIYLAPLTAEKIVLEAVRVFKEAYERGDFRGINVAIKVGIENKNNESNRVAMISQQNEEKELWATDATPQRKEIMKVMQKVLGKEQANKLREEIKKK